ncbi:chromosome segregation protein SMC [Oceaniserpentilla sp. 4NH20-0058]|uniref:chromosome segregation protein SMC n=1 Tax=Oceaniserpentilla sp. 4NH20-0058 TaxID=3127660 RepID=UPI00310270D3
MRLKSIKLAGFKSFVDPTKIPFPTNLTCIVGPNGCGKSNTIDAVRWVMGESSAKNLRGDAMTDVIFNGSTGRKPVGQASIELVFDNSEGKLQGEYAQYTEISLKRKVTRDGQSTYYLNGTKCRRRDVTDLFLGTGLGPRSYAIIEQGMISKLIESKPDELRVYIEEAAGISKYKERRRETENRIRRTTENLERLSDIREELGRQIGRLQRQAEAAEKYKNFKEDERLVRAQLLAMRWKNMDNELAQINQVIAEQELALEQVLTVQVQDESQVEEKRIVLVDLTDEFEKVQTQFYELGGNLGRLEQSIQFQSQRSLQLNSDLQEIIDGKSNIAQQEEEDALALEALDEQLMELEPESEMLYAQEEASQETLIEAEDAMQNWQHSWDAFNEKSAEPQRIAEVSKSQIQNFEQNITRIQQRIERLQREVESLQIGDEAEEQLAMLDEQLSEKELQFEQQQQDAARYQQQVEAAREQQQDLSQKLNDSRSQLQSVMGRKASLEALQQAALGTDGESGRWLQSQQLHQNKRLADELQVQSGWELAVETVLAEQLQAVVVPSIDQYAERLLNLNQGQMTLMESQGAFNQSSQSLAAQTSGVSVPWLNDVLCAQDLTSALEMRKQLQGNQSVITPEGIWLGPNWIRVKRSADDQSGVLARKQELEELTIKEDDLDALVEELDADLESTSLRINTLEQQRNNAQREVNHAAQQLSDHKSTIHAQKVRLEQQVGRRNQLLGEITEQKEGKTLEQESLEEARIQWQTALQDMEHYTQEREQLLEQRDVCRERLDQIRQSARHQKDQAHQQQLKVQTLQHQRQSLMEAISRHEQDKQKLLDRESQLLEQQDQGDSPVEELKAQYEEMMQQRLDVEELMKASRSRKELIENEIREFEQNRQQLEQKAQGVRSQLEQSRMQYQTIHTRRGGIEEQLKEQEVELEQVLEQLADDANIEGCQLELEQIQQRITRLGAINLAAIEEFKTQSERKEYLDKQNADLEKALETLENAIHKIDKETRTRFKETFDKVNGGLKELFPKVFGGGHAYLELTGDDLLDTGVAIMARPPGKKNSTIHLLSGGEKALTAIALVFSIFRLKPAPFCMLDEVDAPLDDANVGRYARLVEAMSEQVQFIYISHNKIAMEMAKQLMGVTMHEPGVSRIVSVNMEEAVELTEH